MANETKAECPMCGGAGSVSDQVEWSDGLGGVQARCELCDGAGTIGDLVALALRHKRNAGQARGMLHSLLTHVHCYLSTTVGPLRGEGELAHIPGFPGASTHSTTWLRYLKEATGPIAAQAIVDAKAMAARSHAEGHHSKPPPAHACNDSCSRTYCAACNAEQT